jgi:hypothetical protein
VAWRKARRGAAGGRIVNRSKKGNGRGNRDPRGVITLMFTIVIGLVFVFQDVPELESHHLISESRRRPFA